MQQLLTHDETRQLVPVQYRRLNGKVYNSHQYSVTEYFTSSKVSSFLHPRATGRN